MEDKLVTIKVRQSTRELLKIEARKNGLTLNEFIIKILKEKSNGNNK